MNSCCCGRLPAVVSHWPGCDAECLQHLPLHSITTQFPNQNYTEMGGSRWSQLDLGKSRSGRDLVRHRLWCHDRGRTEPSDLTRHRSWWRDRAGTEPSDLSPVTPRTRVLLSVFSRGSSSQSLSSVPFTLSLSKKTVVTLSSTSSSTVSVASQSRVELPAIEGISRCYWFIEHTSSTGVCGLSRHR